MSFRQPEALRRIIYSGLFEARSQNKLSTKRFIQKAYHNLLNFEKQVDKEKG
jgi:hypothetical protein